MGILDPHRKYIDPTRDDGTIESGQLLKISEFCKHASHSSLLDGMFGFSSKSCKEFEGTIFRFPFRKQGVKSHLSNTVYSADKVVSDLYQSFQLEAARILLFLKHVTAIKLFTWDTKGSCQEHYLSVTISASNLSDVNLMRKSAEVLCNCSLEESSSAVTNLYTCKVEVTAPAENAVSTVQVYNWLICNTVGTSESSIKQMAKDLNVAPWVGIAVQVPTDFVLVKGCELDWKDFSVSSEKVGINIVKAYDVLQRELKQLVVKDATSFSIPNEGYAFCFLPLPAPTGLPVSVHGYFSVADNRRSIKWPAPDVKGNDAKWNEELVHSLLIPTYAILVAARTKMFTFSSHGDLPYSWWPDPHCVEYSPTWSSIIPDLSSLLIQLPVFWTGANGGEWVSQDGAIFLPPTCPRSVANLLLQLGFAVVHIPNHVLRCFGKTAIKFASELDVCQYLKSKSSEAKTMMSSEITVVHEFLEYFANSRLDFSHLIGLPIILLNDSDMSPAFLQEKDHGDPLYVMLDKSIAAVLPGLEDKIVSLDIPNDIAELYKMLAETEKFQLQIASPKVVASSLLYMSMDTWCNPDTEVHWTPDQKGHPSRDWLVKVWEWLAKQEIASNSSKEFVLLDLAKALPIVPVESLDDTGLAETTLLPLSDAIIGVILQMPQEPDEDTLRISCVCQKLGIKIVQYSLALNKLAHPIVPTLNPLALLQAMMVERQTCNMSMTVKTLGSEERDGLRKYLGPSVDAKQAEKASSPPMRACVDFLKSIPFHTVKDRNVTRHSTVSAQIVFPAPNVNLPESIQLFQPMLCYPASELGFYKVLLGRNPELLPTLVQKHILPYLQDEENNTPVFLWILQNLCDSDSHLITTLKETAFLPSQNYRLHRTCELFDPKDKKLRSFLSTRHPAFPRDDFTAPEVLAKLQWLEIQTWSKICSTEQTFITFVLDQAKSLANISREEGLKKSEHLVREVANSEFCKEAFAALADVPFLFCEICPPYKYPGLSWFGHVCPEKAHRPTEIYASVGLDLSHIIGSVCPVLSTEYRNTPDLVRMCCQADPANVVDHLRNVVRLPEHVLKDEESIVTAMMHQVYSYLSKDANSVIEMNAPSSIWHPQHAMFVPLSKVALYPIDSLYMIPYRFDIRQLDDMEQYMKLWKSLGVRESLDDTDCEEVLLEIQAATNEVSLAAEDMKVVHSILQYLRSKSCLKGALLPTKRNGLMNPLQCVFDDCEWLEKYPELDSHYSLVCTEVSRELAHYFGAVPLSQRIANPMPLEISVVPEHETRPVEALVREWRDLYQHKIDPFLDMIQIADCASATSVKFIFDWRKYAAQSLFSKKMAELQGPALFVIINSVLTEDTVKNLCNIGSVHLNESEQSRLHPSDGCDFCSVYHLTDLPMLWNAAKLFVFDPMQAYVPLLASKPSHGVRFNTDQNMDELQAYYGDQLKPFLEVSSYCSSDMCSPHSSHALFRLPFRSASKEFTPCMAEQVVSAFVCIADSLPVFLQNVKEVEFCELGVHSHESVQITSLLSVVKAPIPVPPVVQSMQSGLKCCEVKSTVKNEDSLSKWLVVSQPSQDKIQVDLAVSVVQENSSFLITSPPKGQKLFSNVILNHTASPWQNCLVNVCLTAADGKQLKVRSTAKADVLIDAASDSVSSALLRVLTIAQGTLGLSGACLAEQDLDLFYYKLWPTDPRRVRELLDKADSAQAPIVHCVGGTWECLRSCVVMNERFRQPPFLPLCSCFQEIMMHTGCKVAKIPKHIMELSTSCLKVMDLKTFCEQVFFGNIHTLPVQKVHKVLFFILEHYHLLHSMEINLDEKLKSNKCIPTAPNDHLNVPQALIDRSSIIGRLYSEEDGRFVNCSEKAKATLKELGMKSERLSDEDVVERANSVSRLACHSAAQERSRLLLNYIFSCHQCNDSLGVSLSEIPFLPVECQQKASHLPWSRFATQLYCSHDLYLPDHQKLVFTQCPVLDPSIDSRCHTALQFKGEPPTDVVVGHLVALVECVNVKRESMTPEDWKTIHSSIQAVYDYLNTKAQENSDTLQEALFKVTLRGQGIIWDSSEQCFLKRDTVALELPIGLSTLHPFRKTGADLECLRQYVYLWQALQVKERFEVHDCIQVLAEMQGMCSEQPLAEQHLTMVVDILGFMQKHDCKEGALIPTAKGTLCSPDKTVFDDRRWSEKNENLQSRFIFAHSRVPGEVAKYFGVQPVSSKIASPQQLKVKFKVKKSGQHESLTRRLRGIVEDYKDNIDVFKELIQNADDAGATKVKFLLDWRQHPRENLFTDELANWQGPALYAYNDSVFSEEDFANICELGGATKRCDPLKIGRFGLGFCATYQLTDVPSFVSGTQLTIFDPHKQYIGDIMAGDSPGLRVDILEGRSDLQDFLSGHVAVYEDLFGCSLLRLGEKGFQGTLFRFPFRTQELAVKSKISSMVIDQSNVEQLTAMLYDAADTLLVFLRNVASIELYELTPNSHPSDMDQLLSVEKRRLDSQADLIQRYVTQDVQSASEVTSTPETFEALEATSMFSINTPEADSNESSPMQNDPTQYQLNVEQFFIKVYCKSSEARTSTWLVSSAVGGQRLKHFDECAAELKKETFLPMAEVAVCLVDGHGTWLPHPVQGKVFCFLPLPINIGQKFLVNGCFTLSKDRRHLSELEDSTQSTNSHNKLLIQEPLTQAVLKVLHILTTICYSHVSPASLQQYYSLWPLVSPTDHPLSKELKQSFKKAVHNIDYPLIWSLKNGGMWIPVCKASVLDRSFSHTVFDTFRSDIMSVLVMQQYNMVDVSEELYEGITQGATSVKKVSVLEYYTEVLLPNLHAITDKTVRDSQILFLVTHFQTLKDIAEGSSSGLTNALRSTCCIPCEPNGKLSFIEDLVLPTSTFRILFKEDEDRFPCSEFSNNVMSKQTLIMLGMHTEILKEEDVVTRAEIVPTLPEEEANIYCFTLSKYLTEFHSASTELLDQLSGVVFFPLHMPDSSLTLPWYEHAEQRRFGCPKDVYHPSDLPLVFTFAPVAYKELLGPCLDIFRCKMKHTPSGEDVWNHTKRIVAWATDCPAEISEVEVHFLNDCMGKIYAHLEMKLSTSPDFVDLVQRECGDSAFLWQDQRFHKPSQMVHIFTQGDSCYPYLVKVNRGLSRFEYLLQASRVESTVTVKRAEILLKRIFDDHGSTAVGAQLVCFARALVSAVYPEGKDQDGIFYLPDTDEVMQPSTKLVNKEFDDPSDINAELVSMMPDSTLYLHTSIPKLEAKYFGVQDVLSVILGQMIDPDFAEEEFEQHEPLEVRINNILAQCRADESIFREFIQNADDACATEIAFVLDHRCNFGTQSLAVSGSAQKWNTLQKLPSLLIYNNRKFSEKDIKGISKLGLGSKQEESNKIGHFGLGFNAAYHVTDCPMFLSHDSGGERDNFCVFDPLCSYLPPNRRKPRCGLRYKLKGKEKAAAKFADQFEPFRLDLMHLVSLPGCFEDMHSTTLWPNGYVVFRLPLTRLEQSSHLRNAERMTKDKLKESLDALKKQAPNMLLFLNNLQRITMVEVSQDEGIADLWSIGATSTIQTFASELSQAVSILKNPDEMIPQTFSHICDVDMQMCCPSNSEVQTLKWVVCHRFGGGDMSREMIRDSFEKQHLLPVAAVAAPVGCRAAGQLFCSLPVSDCTDLPVHVHGKFTVDPSRKFLESSDWNSALTEIVARAYVDLLVYCRQKVSLLEETQVWYYSLFPSSGGSIMNVLLVPKVYQQLLKLNAEVLLAASSEEHPAWHALSYDDEAQNKGWFPVDVHTLVKGVLLSIGMNIVVAPTTLQQTVESLESCYHGAVTPHLVRSFLQKMVRPDYDRHKKMFSRYIVPLLSYVLQDVDKENVAKVEGLPLMLSDSGEFKLIQMDQPLFTRCFVELIPRHSKCRGEFASPAIEVNSRLYLKLQNLQLLKQVTPEVIADNVELPRSKVVPMSECNHVVLQLLWGYILDYNTERRQHMLKTIFGSLAIVPTSLNTVVPINMAHMVLKHHGSVPLLSQLDLPIVNFTKLSIEIRSFTSADQQMDDAAIHAIATAAVSPLLCDPTEPCDVLAAIEAHEPPAGFQPNGRADVESFITFLLKCPHIHQYEDTLRKLKIFELALEHDTWVSAGKDVEMFAVNCHDFPSGSLQPLRKEKIQICRLYNGCEKFFEAVGISVPTPVEFYQTTILPAFASHTFCAKDKIDHLEFILGKETMWKDLQAELKKCHFIDCNGEFCSLLQLFDPTVELLTTFLPQTAFPQPPWSDQPTLEVLRKLGLQQEVSDEEVKKFAETVQDCSTETAKKKSSVLLRHLKNLIKKAKRENELVKVQKLLSFIAGIAFIPRYFSPLASTLTDIGVAQLCIESSAFVCLQGSVVCDAEHASLTSLCKPVVLAKHLFSKYVDKAKQARLCDSAHVTPLSTEVVLNNLLHLIHLVEVCQITSSTKCRDALFSLQNTFKNHYQFLSKDTAARSLKGVPCIFVPSSSGDSFQIVQGNKLVERVSHESRGYCHLLFVVPDYLNDPNLREFREQVGIQRSLNASHYLSLLKDIHNDLQQQEEMNARCDPNLLAAANAAYRDLVLLLCGTEDASRQAEREVTSAIEGGDQVYLPSRNGKLLPAEKLVLCDDDWIHDKLTAESDEQLDFEFIVSPPPIAAHSLPSCLKVRKLSELVTEEIDSALLKDEYNLCTTEVYAQQHGAEHLCTSVITLLTFVRAPEFAVGIQRIMHHKLAGEPLVGDCERALDKIVRMDCVCVRKIQTCFKYNGRLIQGAGNQDMSCFLATKDSGELNDDSNVAGPAAVLYVRFHDNVDDLLAEVVMQLNKVLGPFISDTQHLQAILKCITEPGKIQGALDHLHIKRYTSASTVSDRVMLSSQPEVEGNELILVCNFRANEQVMYCDAHGHLKLCVVESVTVAHTANSHPLSPSLSVLPPVDQGGLSSDTAAATVTSFLVCKFLSPGQMQLLETLLNGQLGDQSFSSTMPGDKLVLLEVPQSNSEQLQMYLAEVMSLLSSVTNEQKYFVTERLLFHLHFLSQVRRGSLDFENVAKVFVTQVQKWFKGGTGDHTEFIHSLEKKIRVLRGEVPEEADVPPPPPVPTCMDQANTSQMPPPSSSGAQGMHTHHLSHYSRLSSWSTNYGSSTPWARRARAGASRGLSQHSGISGSSAHRVFPTSGGKPQVSLSIGTGTLRPINIWQPSRATFYTPVVEQQPETSVADAQMWLTQACHDLKLAQHLVGLVQSPSTAEHEQGAQGGAPSASEYPEAVCFYSHEIVEKALKAVFLAYCGLKHDLAASNNVVDLFEKLKNSKGCPEEVKGTDECIYLVSRHGRCCRFPDDNLPPAAPVLSHSTATAKETLSAALRFLKAVSKLQLFRDYFPDDTMEINIKKLTEETGTTALIDTNHHIM